jgi:hypothetical protein
MTSSSDNDDPLHELRPELLLVCGAVGLIGNLAPLLAMLVAWPVAEHDLVADTISDLARGPHKWIMDTGFYFGAAGLLGLAIGAAHLHLGRWGWSAGLLCLSFLAMVIVLLGLWDDLVPADGRGMTVHGRLTFLLGPLYLAGPLLMMAGVRRIGRWMSAAFIISAVLWIVLATAFKLSPDDIDGLVEKIAVAATLLWTLPLSGLLLRVGMSHRDGA